MRVLHCIHSLDPRGGGPADFVRQAASLQAAQGFEMEVACLDSASAPWLKDFPAAVHALGPGLGNYGYSKEFVPWLKAHCVNFDAVVVNGIWQYSSLGAWLGLRDSATPYVVFPHGMLDPWFNQNYPLKHLKKQLYWLVGDWHVLRDARAVFFTSDTERKLSATSFVPYQAKAVTVPYGTNPPPIDLDSDRQALFKEYPFLKNKLIFLYLGRVHAKKGCDLLIGAFQQVLQSRKDAHLIVAGPGAADYCLEMSRLIGDESGITRIDRLISGGTKWGMLAAADALILPSHQENFARVVSEALSCSTPVLLSDKVNIYEQVVTDGAGFVAPDTREGTLSLLERFLALTDEERGRMKTNALSCYRKNFDLTDNFRRYLEILERSCARKSDGCS